MALNSVIKSVDPITFEILSHKLYQVTKQMGATLERVGGTVNTTQQKDYMAGLYRANGEILCAGDSMGWQVACAGFAVRTIIERYGGKEVGIFPDDMFLLNDPYLAAIHQSDVYLVSPIHFNGKLVGWSATFVHVADVGAMSPGGNSPGATEVFHEGLRIPGVKLVERGKLRRDVFDTIIHMTRQPGMVGLDLKCEVAANNVAKSRMQEMYRDYGEEMVDAVAAEMIDYSESVLRNRLSEVADGNWSDRITIQAGDAWTVRVNLRKKNSSLVFDFTGSDKQLNRGINLPYHATFGACYESVISTMGYDLPKNQGIFRCMEVVAPRGTVVNVEPPGPVSMNTTATGCVVKYHLARSVLMQMLATSPKWKEEATSTSAYGRTARHAGLNQYGRYYVSGLGSELALGGGAARQTGDGVDSGASELSCPNVEWVELNFPLLFLFRRHTKDGAGAGAFRGGVGAESALMLHDAPQGKLRGVAMGVAGLRNSGQGIFGGYPGAPSLLVLKSGTRAEEIFRGDRSPVATEELGGESRLLSYSEFELAQKDVLYYRTFSGGGYGDPLDRDPNLVLADVVNGIVSPAAARECYGVLIDEQGLAVDVPGTQKLRAEIKGARLRRAPLAETSE
jgi:N-methylhydantoinase B